MTSSAKSKAKEYLSTTAREASENNQGISNFDSRIMGREDDPSGIFEQAQNSKRESNYEMSRLVDNSNFVPEGEFLVTEFKPPPVEDTPRHLETEPVVIPKLKLGRLSGSPRRRSSPVVHHTLKKNRNVD